MKYKTTILKNGARLVMITNLSTNAVTLAAFIKAGFRFDPTNKPGLAHFTEHMIFNGTESFPTTKEEAQAIEKYGGWHMAFTWIEHQKHIVHVPKNHISIGLKVLLETLSRPLIKKSEVEKEKGVVQEEILKNLSDPTKAIWDYAWLPLFFQNTHISRPYSGTIEDVKKISHVDVKKFINNNYTSKNTVFIVAGDIEEKLIIELIEKDYKVSNHLNKKNKFNPLIPQRDKRVLVHKETSYHQTSIFIGVETVSYTSQIKPVLEIIREILGGFYGTNLIQTLRDKGGLIYDWACYTDNFTESGYIVFNVSVAHENVYKVISIILKEFNRLADGNISNKEIEIAKGHLIGSIYANVETGLDFVEWYGMQELLNHQNVLSVQKQIDIYKKIKKQTIIEIASKFLNKDKILIGLVGNAEESRVMNLLK
ncbi:MAG: pitrilysin family protein [bacterium]